jgi:hypothetical protein
MRSIGFEICPAHRISSLGPVALKPANPTVTVLGLSNPPYPSSATPSNFTSMVEPPAGFSDAATNAVFILVVVLMSFLPIAILFKMLGTQCFNCRLVDTSTAVEDGRGELQTPPLGPGPSHVVPLPRERTSMVVDTDGLLFPVLEEQGEKNACAAWKTETIHINRLTLDIPSSSNKKDPHKRLADFSTGGPPRWSASIKPGARHSHHEPCTVGGSGQLKPSTIRHDMLFGGSSGNSTGPTSNTFQDIDTCTDEEHARVHSLADHVLANYVNRPTGIRDQTSVPGLLSTSAPLFGTRVSLRPALDALSVGGGSYAMASPSSSAEVEPSSTSDYQLSLSSHTLGSRTTTSTSGSCQLVMPSDRAIARKLELRQSRTILPPHLAPPSGPLPAVPTNNYIAASL